jgi:hypothetical protein
LIRTVTATVQLLEVPSDIRFRAAVQHGIPYPQNFVPLIGFPLFQFLSQGMISENSFLIFST